MSRKTQPSSERPNIILILCDDLGYGDLGCYGNTTIATPNIDRMAEDGLRFTDFYASATFCMPSRKGLMTGVHPYRGDLYDPRTFTNRTYLPQMLKDRGYATALIGKWHLRMDAGRHPLDKGFDYFYGTEGSNDPTTITGQKQIYETFKTARSEEDWPVSLYRNHTCIENPAKQSLFTRRYTEEAIRVIGESKRKGDPFFIYLAHNMPHVPIFASDRFKGRSKAGIYGDVVEELDWSVGEILRSLEERNLRDNTIVVFTSDNGPWTMFREFGGSAGPLRGEKGIGWEGGPRVPGIFYWPGRIKPGVISAFMVNLDLYVTLAHLTNSDLPSDYRLDSLDMSGVLLRGEESPRSSYLFYSGARFSEPFSYRSRNYKIHLRTNDRSRDPITFANVPVEEHAPPLLFDLGKEISETTNIANNNPEVLEALNCEFHAAARSMTQEGPEPGSAVEQVEHDASDDG